MTPQKYSLNDHLMTHEIAHECVKVYKYIICWKGFAYIGDLITHGMAHIRLKTINA